MSSSLETRFIDFLIKRRVALAFLSVIITAIIAQGATSLYFEADYKIYFKDDDQQLLIHEEIQDTYTSTDNLTLMLKPRSGDVFTEEILSLVFDLTEAMWQTPYAMRVDSITNFQHTSADGDDLLVEDVLLEKSDLTAEKIASIKDIVLNEPQLYRRMISKSGQTTVINVDLELPPRFDPNASAEVQIAQRSARDGSYLEVVGFGRDLVAQINETYPHIEAHLNGVTMTTNAFNEVGQHDAQNLVPIMYLVILLVIAVFLRSVGAMVATTLVIAFSSVVAVSSAAWFGFPINSANVTAPTIVLTIAVCDAVHMLTIYLRGLAVQLDRFEAMREAIRLNLQPIVLTSVTTAVGFLTLNFAASPPFGQLGNMTAVGVIWAMVLSFTLLPAVVLLITRKRKPSSSKINIMDWYADWVIRNRKLALVIASVSAVIMVSFLPKNEMDDDPFTYFEPGIEFRNSMDFAVENLPGARDFSFSIGCGASSCINDPTFLSKLEQFKTWLEAQEGVIHVSTYVDVIKRLNKSMNADDPAFLKVPEQADLSAQYNLLYEMSLPYGLDLNNQLNLDKSETKVTIFAGPMRSPELIELSKSAHQWLLDNVSEDVGLPSSVPLMFAHVGLKNVFSMMWGALYAVIAVTITILIALRSFKYAMISLIPNSIPALMAFGVWGATVSVVNMAVAIVFSISLGILVDDTVHFISKYRRAREVKGFTPEASIKYAFQNVGSALVVTTTVLCAGFFILTLSPFAVNSMAGALTGITIAIALVFDFLILPPILMIVDRKPTLTA